MSDTNLDRDAGIRRIAVFTEILPFSVRRGIAEVLRELPEARLLVVEQRRPRTAMRVLRSQWRGLRRNGWRHGPEQLRAAWEVLARRLRRPPVAAGARPGGDFELEALRRHPRVSWLRATDLHAGDCVAALREFAPDVGLSLAAPILKPSVFAVPRLGTLNLHKGKLPDYRGMPAAFWELWDGAAEVGCTVHAIDEGLDTGRVLVERAVPRPPHATLRGMQLVLDEVGVELTTEALRRVQAGSAVFLPARAGGRLHRKPTLAQQAELARRLRPKPSEPALRAVAKAAAFLAHVHVVRRLMPRPAVVILLYHRVSDELRDKVTVGVEQFHDQMAYLARRCSLVGLDEVVRGQVPARAPRPLVAVTFDDGYLDNYQNAVPILLRERVPATFFVSTGHIDSGKPFAHDLHKLGRALPMMSWDHLRRMRSLGFTIGSHTVNHIDCAKASRPVLRRELAESRDRLRQELDLDEVLFAYPFGRRENMTPEALEAVVEAGYACCCSAYGGVNGPAYDRFDLRRIGINWSVTPLAFRARLAGLAWQGGQRQPRRRAAAPRVAPQQGAT